MVLVEYDTKGEIKRIGKQLGGLHDKAPKVLATATNSTARRINTLMKQAIRKTYTYHRSDKMKGAFKLGKKATTTSPSATITVVSESPHLSDFKVTPAAPTKDGYEAVKAQVLKRGGEKSIQMGDIKAFIAKFSNSKIAVAQRLPGATYTRGRQARAAKYGDRADMTKIKALFGPSITKMAAKVHEESVASETEAILQDNIQKQIKKMIAKQMEGK